MQLDADTSFPSLQFTESSMDGFSLDQVVQQIDRNMPELSSLDGSDIHDGLRHSTPQFTGASNSEAEVGGCALVNKRGKNDDLGRAKSDVGGSGGALELVGREVKCQVRSGVKTLYKAPPAVVMRKTKVRNYNEKNS